MKKNYDRPETLVTMIKLGVYGQYGLTDRDEIYSLELPERHSTAR